MWSSFGQCAKSCGSGERMRLRTCVGGSAGQVGCEGKEEDFGACNTHPCPEWTNWADWGACSVSCGTGQSKRTRICFNGLAGDFGCEGERSETQPCNTQVRG